MTQPNDSPYMRQLIARHWIWIERRSFRFALSRAHLSIVFRRHGQPVAGIHFKPKSEMTFSEREGCWRGMVIGRYYVRTFSKVKSL